MNRIYELFLKRNKRVMLSVTYKSCDVLVKIMDKLTNAFIIIDEFHNLVSGYINEGLNYSKLFKLLTEAENSKFILMSGTPLQDRIKEVYVILNLLLPSVIKQDLQPCIKFLLLDMNKPSLFIYVG